ncbi:MAG: hypothetical protein ACO38K_10120, partial [Ilumatobacteraceae bacterium]
MGLTPHRIPEQITGIDLDWLNDVMPDDIGTIAEFDVESMGVGVGILGELARLHLNYEGMSRGPATVIAKCQAIPPENPFLG